MATVNLGRIKFVWQGAYNGATAYVADDVVSYNGSSYICILASTGNLPTNTTYWNLMAQTGTDITSIAGLAQGDVLYYNGTAWVRLGAGTSGQFLKTNGAGANPAWSTVATGANAGEIIQVKSATDSTTRTTTSTSYVTASNTLTVSITPSATANKIFIIVNASYTYNSAYTLRLTVYRDATNLASNAFVANHTGSTELPLSFSYLDSPNTTSAITYQVYIKTSGGTANFNEANGISTITCMEVKG